MDYFANIARDYDGNDNRVDNVDNIAKAIIGSVRLEGQMEIADFGSGTGLLLERIAPHVKKITAIDISSSMNEQLFGKQDHIACELEIIQKDLTIEDIGRHFDGIISSMTMHHVKDIDAMFRKFYQMVKPGGFIAISDLDSEDGSFHTEDTGVHHAGFSREAIAATASRAGFRNVSTSSVSVVRKPQGEFSVFLLTGVSSARYART